MSESEHEPSSSREAARGKSRALRKPGLKIRLFHIAHVLRRPMTLGVRVIALDEAGRVFLVRHTYVSGWHLPGGGVDLGETTEEAVRRELREEGNLDLPRAPTLVSVHYNDAASRRDHVLLYRCDGAVQTAIKPADREIAECGFFPLDALPADTTKATRRRLAEAKGELVADPYW